MMSNDYEIGQCYACRNRQLDEGNKRLYCTHPAHKSYRNINDYEIAYIKKLNEIGIYTRSGYEYFNIGFNIQTKKDYKIARYFAENINKYIQGEISDMAQETQKNLEADKLKGELAKVNFEKDMLYKLLDNSKIDTDFVMGLLYENFRLNQTIKNQQHEINKLKDVKNNKEEDFSLESIDE